MRALRASGFIKQLLNNEANIPNPARLCAALRGPPGFRHNYIGKFALLLYVSDNSCSRRPLSFSVAAHEGEQQRALPVLGGRGPGGMPGGFVLVAFFVAARSAVAVRAGSHLDQLVSRRRRRRRRVKRRQARRLGRAGRGLCPRRGAGTRRGRRGGGGAPRASESRRGSGPRRGQARRGLCMSRARTRGPRRHAEGGAGEHGVAPLELARGVVRDEEGARGGERAPEAAGELHADGVRHEGTAELLEAAPRFRQRDLGGGQAAGREREKRKTGETVISLSRFASLF